MDAISSFNIFIITILIILICIGALGWLLFSSKEEYPNSYYNYFKFLNKRKK